jgi:GNAT superfamily N-acetyltransferase
MSLTSIHPVHRRRDLKRFIELPYRLHRDDPHWVPPLRMSEWERFDPRRNPFYQHARVQPYLALRGEEVVGRIAAIDDDHHLATHRDGVAFFGYFEATDEEAAGLLLRTVEGWAAGLGRSALRGPANPCMNDGAGLQIDGFERDPFIMMPFNPPAYPGYVEAAGYRKVKDLYAWYVDETNGLGERLARLVDRVERRLKPTIRPVDLRHLDRELSILKRFYNEAWEDNWGFVKYTDAEFDHLAAELRLVLDPDIALIAEVDGEFAGLALTLPDANQVLKRMGGRLLPWGFLALLNRRRIIDQVRMPILGLMPAFRRTGLELVLIREVWRRGTVKGYRRCECSWILEDNEAMNAGIRAAGGYLAKTYRIYQKPV